jgi:hypothetical protein
VAPGDSLALHRQTIFTEPQRSPESDSALVPDEHIQSKPWDIPPNIFEQPLKGGPSEAAPTRFGKDEELAHENELGLAPCYDVPNRSAMCRENVSFVPAVEEIFHARFKFRNRHRITMAFIANEFVIELRQ